MSKELIERLRNTTYHNLDPYEAADRIEQLQRRIEYLELCCDEGERQLATSQLREQQLRGALDNHSGNYVLSKDECKRINALLDAPSDTTALEALIKKAGDVMRERAAKGAEKEAVQIVVDGREERAYNNAVADCANAIRALPSIKLEDIIK